MTETTQAARERKGATASTAGPSALIGVFGFFGALVYFWTQADSAGEHVLAILQALVWPAYLVFGLLRVAFG